ncbi:uncharacterized protein LOC108863903, partial [Galendromus occidentalis]|uniref:Uncharacterized protein LOC108863903 n=1 Tax=Galendromus occidentalis TaxID=34638 RepID=A0AAJ7L500_9ACAR
MNPSEPTPSVGADGGAYESTEVREFPVSQIAQCELPSPPEVPNCIQPQKSSFDSKSEEEIVGNRAHVAPSRSTLARTLRYLKLKADKNKKHALRLYELDPNDSRAAIHLNHLQKLTKDLKNEVSALNQKVLEQDMEDEELLCGIMELEGFIEDDLLWLEEMKIYFSESPSFNVDGTTFLSRDQNQGARDLNTTPLEIQNRSPPIHNSTPSLRPNGEVDVMTQQPDIARGRNEDSMSATRNETARSQRLANRNKAKNIAAEAAEKSKAQITFLGDPLGEEKQPTMPFEGEVPEDEKIEPPAMARNTIRDKEHHSSNKNIDPMEKLASILEKRFLPEGLDSEAKFLPKLEEAIKLPKFGGNVQQFRDFSQQFEMFVHQRPVPELQKYITLRNHLYGKALTAVQHLSMDAANYEIARQILRTKFGDGSYAAISHLKELERILSSGPELAYDKLSVFVTEISQHIYSLIALGRSYQSLHDACYHKILGRLSYTIAREATIRAENSARPPLQVLLDYLMEEGTRYDKAKGSAQSYGETNQSPHPRRGSRYPPPSPRRLSVQANQSRPFTALPSSSAAMPRRQYQSEQPRYLTDQRPPMRFYQNQPDRQQHQPEYTERRHLQSFLTTKPETPARDPRSTNPPPRAKLACLFCEENHPSFRCTRNLTVTERRERARSVGACLRCLKLNHDARHCKEGPRSACRNCGGMHYALICPKVAADIAERPTVRTSSNLNGDALNSAESLWTACVIAKVGDKEIKCRILVDAGSQSSHVTTEFVKKLGAIPKSQVDLVLSTAGGQISNLGISGVFDITLISRHNPKKRLVVECMEVECLTRSEFPIMKHDLDVSPLADEQLDENAGSIDILLGHSYVRKIEFGNAISLPDMFVFESMFGWIVAGDSTSTASAANQIPTLTKFCGVSFIQSASSIRHRNSENSIRPIVIKTKKKSEAELRSLEDIEKIWQMDDIGLQSPEGEGAEEQDGLFQALREYHRTTTTRNEEGRYRVRLPFKDNIRELGDNRSLAISRLHSFLAKLKRDPEKLRAVDTAIYEYVEKRHAELAAPKLKEQLVHYLPVQAVFKGNADSSLDMKTRVVKDASARSLNKAGLNDVIHAGENLLPDIGKVLLKFRQYPIVFTADIQAAFQQIEVARPDRTAKTRYPEEAEFIEEIIQTYYIDDFGAGANDLESAKHRVDLLIRILHEACLPLAKWSTNSAELAEYIKAVSLVPNPTITTGQQNAKFLGVGWDQMTDALTAQTSKAMTTLENGTPTKRRLLRGLAQIFDPLGILAPTHVTARSILQELWTAKKGWDSALTGNLAENYVKFVSQLRTTASTKIPRALFKSSQRQGAVISHQVFTFSDASTKAIGCVAYLRTIRIGCEPQISFLMAKGRVAPVKKTSVQRLELSGALLAARVMSNVKKGLDPNIHISAYNFLTDNKSVMAWVHSKPERFKAYVANRVRIIQRLTKGDSWSWVPSEENPSDIVSRGKWLTGEDKRMWLNGPTWLKESDEKIIERMKRSQRQTEDDLAEVKYLEQTTNTICLNASVKIATNPLFFENSFSSITKAIKFWALMRRLKQKANEARLRVSSNRRAAPTSRRFDDFHTEEIEESKIDLIRITQKKYFKDEYESNCKSIKRSSKLYEYAPRLDDDGIIRATTRLQRTSELTLGQRSPILMPYESRISELIVKHAHEKHCLHTGGVASSMHHVRKEFLILRARKLTRKVLANCAICKIFGAPPASLATAQLPAWRIEQAQAFSTTGIDFAGPIRYRKENKEVAKSYILVCTCAVSRAVCLFLTTDMSTAEVLGALQKLISRYPALSTLVSDNGASFRRAAKELQVIYEETINLELKKWLSTRGIKWEFVAPLTPWMNGFTERQVQSVKRPLRKILRSSIPFFRDLEVILANIEAVINQRPITVIATKNGDLEALTPYNLISGQRGTQFLPQHRMLPSKRRDADAIVYSARHKYQQRLLTAYWKLFEAEYLTQLRSAMARKPLPDRHLNLGDICLI